jgi:predicted glycogen debranching enzyme
MTSPLPIDERTEWLESDGLGGFASGTTSGLRTRRYHALLLSATTPPTGRMALVNGLDAWVELGAGPEAGAPPEYLTRQQYAPDVVVPDDAARIESFDSEPWPTWTYQLRDGTRIVQEILVPRGLPAVAVRWRALSPVPGRSLSVRLFLSGRDTHALHHANPAFRFEAQLRGDEVSWRPYDGVPAIAALSNGHYHPDPQWYRSFLYSEERSRGLDCEEDLASPGLFRWRLDQGDAVLVLSVGGTLPEAGAADTFSRLSRSERDRRGRFGSTLERAGDAYLVRRGSGSTIVAGYPWFTDWGRDTFIALRGLCIATGRLADARSILLGWAGLVSQGMLPNRFVDQGDAPEFNSVDASLWYIIAVHDYLRAVEAKGRKVPLADRRAFSSAVLGILAGYSQGTRYGIRLDSDGLLAAGEPGVQLTWMDAKVGDWVVTQRSGKPVEIQALWLNALRIAEEFSAEYREPLRAGLRSFNQRFWNPAAGYLFDVVDVDHMAGATDPTLRPNQVLAIGGLPYAVLDSELARSVVDVVESRLLTPIGLRTLPREDSRYVARYEGGVLSRDGSYHQGTVWPWLLGPFVEAWIRVHGGDDSARAEAARRFLAPLEHHLSSAGLGHISEIADAEPPHTLRGCPFQAWSVAEALRLKLSVLPPTGSRSRSEPDRPHAARR